MRFLSFSLVVLILCFSFSSVFALDIDDITTGDTDDIIDSSGGDDITVDTDVVPVVPDVPSPPSSVDDLGSDYYLADVGVLSLAPITGSDTSGLKAVLLDLIGPYDPVIIEYRYHNPNSSYDSYLREVQPDYVWLCSFAMFALVLYCLFRLGGVLFGRI